MRPGLGADWCGYIIRECFFVACMNPRLAYWMYDHLYITAFGCNLCLNVCIVANTMIIVPTANMMPTCAVVCVDVYGLVSEFTFPHIHT